MIVSKYIRKSSAADMMMTPSLLPEGEASQAEHPLTPLFRLQSYEGLSLLEDARPAGVEIKKCWSLQERLSSLGRFLQSKFFLIKNAGAVGRRPGYRIFHTVLVTSSHRMRDASIATGQFPHYADSIITVLRLAAGTRSDILRSSMPIRLFWSS